MPNTYQYASLAARADAGYVVLTIAAAVAVADIVLWILDRRAHRSERVAVVPGGGRPLRWSRP